MDKANTVEVLGVRVHSIPVSELIDRSVKAIKRDDKIIVSYSNIHAMNLAYEQERFRNFLNRAAYVFCDGVGVKLGARLSGQSLDYRYTPPDWIDDLCAVCAEQGLTMYFLGAKEGVAERAAQKQMKKYPALQVVGSYHGYFDKAPDSEGTRQVVDAINRLKPNILVVGFGMPLQEYWIESTFDQLDINLALPVGALFDYIVGDVYRAPRWITDNGLEWLARLVVEPRRLWRRYIIGNPKFFWRVFRSDILG